MKKVEILILISCLIASSCGLGYFIGIKHTYEKFSLEECWIDKDNRDVVCIQEVN